jgi:hypothetical protein
MFVLLHKDDILIVPYTDIGLCQQVSVTNREGKGMSGKDGPVLGIITQCLQEV